MPEGPELHLSSQFINAVCKGQIFTGKIRRNPIHKCADVDWDAATYTISAVSRGKELKLFLQSIKNEKEEKPYEHQSLESKRVEGEHSDRLHLLFNFGMSGKFEFTSTSEMPKHAHLSFFTKTDPSLALSFVDYRRFGKWQVGADWSSERGPCVLFEYPQFRSNVLSNLSDSAFNKPVCEVLLNQKYFNGIGNYLRAEICFRAGVRPFDQARSVFSCLSDCPDNVKIEDGMEEKSKVKVKVSEPDILELCNIIPLEVVGLGTSLYLPENDESDVSKYSKWLQCYYKPGMKNVADHNKRTMWYHGDPGPMLPKESCSRKRHGVYEKKLTKNEKKVKKNTSSVLQEEKSNNRSGSTTTTTKKKNKKSGQRKETSPIKQKRITRAALKAVLDKSTRPQKQTVSKKTKDTKSDGNCLSGKKIPQKKGRQQPETRDVIQAKSAEIDRKKPATRERVKRKFTKDEGTHSVIKKARK